MENFDLSDLFFFVLFLCSLSLLTAVLFDSMVLQLRLWTDCESLLVWNVLRRCEYSIYEKNKAHKLKNWKCVTVSAGYKEIEKIFIYFYIYFYVFIF